MNIQQAEEKLRRVLRRKHLSYSIGYCHAAACSIPSPLGFRSP